MEGRKKERVMAAAVFVLVILLSAQRLPVGVANGRSAFCRCYAACIYPDCGGVGWHNCNAHCCAVCNFPGDDNFDSVCGDGHRASTCGSDTTTTDDAAAHDWSGRHGKAKAKHG